MQSMNHSPEAISTRPFVLNDMPTAATVGKLQTDLAVMVEDAEKKKETAEGIAEVVSREKAVVEVETAKAQKEAAIVAIVEKVNWMNSLTKGEDRFSNFSQPAWYKR